jgi:hypothetical protein
VKLYAAMWAGAPLIDGKAHELVIYNKGEVISSSEELRVKSEEFKLREANRDCQSNGNPDSSLFTLHLQTCLHQSSRQPVCASPRRSISHALAADAHSTICRAP